jgi:hypothetical protein
MRDFRLVFSSHLLLVVTNSVVQEPEYSSPHTQQPSTGPCPEQVKSNPQPESQSLQDPRTKSHVNFPVLTLCQIIRPGPRLCVVFRNKYLVLRGRVVKPRPTPRLEDHPISAVRDCLFNIFAATLHIWRPSPLSATRGRAMPWWQWTHLTWFQELRPRKFSMYHISCLHIQARHRTRTCTDRIHSFSLQNLLQLFDEILTELALNLSKYFNSAPYCFAELLKLTQWLRECYSTSTTAVFMRVLISGSHCVTDSSQSRDFIVIGLGSFFV